MAANVTHFMDLQTTNAPEDDCRTSVLWVNFIHYCVIPAVLIVVLLSFLEKRKDDRMKSFFRCSHFAFIYPINLIDYQGNRLSYALAFGATATLVLDIFSGSFGEYYDATSNQPWVRILLGAIGTVEVAVDCYPMFACIGNRNRLVGSIFGFLYSALWFSFQLASVIICPTVNRGGEVSYEIVLGEIPTLLCMFLLMMKFAQEFVIVLKDRLEGKKATLVEKFMKTPEAIYVKNLLKKQEKAEKPATDKDEEEGGNESSDIPISDTSKDSFHAPIQEFFYRHYDPVPGFVYPTRLICTFTVGIICQYQLGIVFFRDGNMALERLFGTVDDTLKIARVQYNWSEAKYEQALELEEGYRIGAIVCWWIASSLAVMFSLMMVAHTFLCYRKHMLRMFSGNKMFLPRDKLTSAECVAGNLQYCGYQIAYYLSGYAIMQGLVFFFIYLITGVVILPFIHYTYKSWMVLINSIIPTVAVLFIVFASQQILANKYFLQKRINPEDWSKPLALQHREGFHNISYFLVFLNVLVGVVAAFVRVLSSLFLGLFLVMRIDRPILMRGFEKYDKSYKAYVGNLMFLNAHSHPVLVCFCRIMYYQAVHLKKRLDDDDDDGDDNSIDCSDVPGVYGYMKSTQAGTSKNALCRPIRRWHVAYTLIFNPKLIESRKASSRLTYFNIDQMLSSPRQISTLRRHRNQVLLRSRGFKPEEIDDILKKVKNKNLGADLVERISRNFRTEEEASDQDMVTVEFDDPVPAGSNDSMTELVGQQAQNTSYGALDQRTDGAI